MSEIENQEITPIVDCDVLEAAKENIQPLASGRRVTALSAVLSTPHAQRESQHNSIKSRHRINITIALEGDDPDDDPLEAYCRFVYWTLDAYPQGHSADSGLLELLEEATRVLKDDRNGYWRGDIRYLKLWVLYANFVEKPTIIYKFLLANDIGTQHALLYEEHGAALERAGRRTEADEAYILGIARQAEPLDRLQNKHREFQKRMMIFISTPTPAPAPASSITTKRTVLGSTKAPLSLSHDDPFTVAPSSAPRSNGRLQVFVDPSGTASQGNLEDDQTPYPDVGTRKTRVKENVTETKKAGGTTLKQAGKSKRVASGPVPSKIAVFRDEDSNMSPPPVPAPSKVPAHSNVSKMAIFKDEEMPPPPVPNTAKTPGKPKGGIVPFRDEQTPERSSPSGSSAALGSMMKLKAGPNLKGDKGLLVTSEAEALRRDPLKNYEGSVVME